LAEMEAIDAAAAAARAKRDPAQVMVLPGLTLKQANDKLEAGRATDRNNKLEVLPGLTVEQANDRLTAARPLKPVEILPGLTQEEANTKAAQSRRQMEGLLLEQVLPKK
jgi:hypothetical protein